MKSGESVNVMSISHQVPAVWSEGAATEADRGDPAARRHQAPCLPPLIPGKVSEQKFL